MGMPCCSFVLLPGHRRLPLEQVRDEHGESGGHHGAQEEARREEHGDDAQKPTKSRRGAASTAATLREIERKILKENTN